MLVAAPARAVIRKARRGDLLLRFADSEVIKMAVLIMIAVRRITPSNPNNRFASAKITCESH